MKILIDIGHPAHVHYFRNAIFELNKKGHQILVTTRDKEVSLKLLDNYGIPYVSTGKNKKGTFNKFLTMLRNDWVIFRVSLKFKPDIYLSFFSPFAAQVGWILRKPVIGITDTEHAKLSIRLTIPFTSHIITPNCFRFDFKKNHFRFNGYMEYFYLHEKYFKPDKSVLNDLKIGDNEPYFIMRLVSFSAGHDIGESGMDQQSKIKIARLLSSRGKLLISSEEELPEDLEPFKIKIDPTRFHSALAFASLYVGEGFTTASECALLGVPSVLINTLTAGYIQDHETNGLLFRYDNASDAYNKIDELSAKLDYKNELKAKSEAIKKELVDCTDYLVNIIDQFPNKFEE
jgi:predicted glycosyltransferase